MHRKQTSCCTAAAAMAGILPKTAPGVSLDLGVPQRNTWSRDGGRGSIGGGLYVRRGGSGARPRPTSCLVCISAAGNGSG